MPTLFRRWIRSLSRPHRPARHAHPQLVALEGRDTPATLVVSNTFDGGPGSLRNAILAANATPGVPDTIEFQILGAPLSVRTISPASALPTITDTLTIDGWSQGVFDGTPGYNGAPLIELTGAAAGAGADGLTFGVGSSAVNGLVVNNFAGSGIVFTLLSNLPGGNSRVFGNYIGTTADGTAAAPNGTGVLVTSVLAPGVGANLDNLIGTDADGVNDAAERNVISGNTGAGVFVDVGNGSGSGAVIRGNTIGLNAAGTAAVPNATGVQLNENGSTVGVTGTEAVPANAGNVISGNSRGVFLFADVAVIAGNVIGLNAARTAKVGNGEGIRLEAGGGTVRIGTNADGTADAAEANVIAGNTTGIDLVNSNNHVIAGNFIGTTAAGTPGLGNVDGIWLREQGGGQAQGNVIGGTLAAARNVIRFNTSAGVRLSGNDVTGNTVQNNVIGSNGFGLRFEAAVGLTANTITGNFIGTDPTATQALGNLVGVLVASDGNTIDGAGLLNPATNTIAANAELLRVEGANNVLTGLRLGTNPAGTAAAFTGPLRNGVGLVLAGDNNTLDGTAAGGANVVSGNASDGVQITGTGNTVRGNFIGTDLAGTTAVPNGGSGVSVSGGGTATIGGITTAARNVISGNVAAGVHIRQTLGALVIGNYIGLSAAGAALGNGGDGVYVQQAPGTVIGGTAAGAGNAIGGNAGNGIRNVSSPATVIQGNRIGTTADGTAAVPNGANGVLVETSSVLPPSSASTNVMIGGAVIGAGNLISGNAGSGVVLQDTGTDDAQVGQNTIGLNAAGTAALGNGGSGVLLSGGPTGTALFLNTVSGNAGTGIALAGASNSQFGGNVVGLTAAGTAAVPNGGGGISLTLNSTNNTIGGLGVLPSNTVSGNTGPGILLDGPGVTGNVIQQGFIGTTTNATAVVPNTGDGVVIRNGAAGNTVTASVVSGNAGAGVRIAAGATSTTVTGNAIGSAPFSLATGFGNGGNGVEIDAANNNTIGGTTSIARNVISGNALNGVLIAGGSSGNVVQGNYIGISSIGSTALPNGTTGVPFVGDGVRIDAANNNTIGGTAAGAGNVLSGNISDGVDLRNGATGNLIAGNLIGTNAAGTAAIGNQEDGVYFEGAIGNTVGGTTAAARNVISGNAFNGVFFYGPGSDNNTVAGNFIGTDAAGTGALGNVLEGVFIWQDPGSGNLTGPSGNTIGGTAAGAGNVIAFNGQTGIKVGLSPADASTDNQFLGNSIFANAGIGIDLGGDGPTANDPGDADAGANDLQNSPILTSALTFAGTTTVAGTFDGLPNKTVRVEFFSNPAGEAQGRTYLGSLDVTTDGTGHAAFTFPTAALAAGAAVTATATDDTSEFSPAVAAVDQVATTTTVSAPAPVVYGTLPTVTVTVTPTTGTATPVGTVAVFQGSTQVASGTLDASGQFSFQLTTSPGAGTHTLAATYTPTDPVFLASSATGTLTVTPAPLTVTAGTATRPYGQPNPAFTASFAGLVNGDTPAALGGALAFATAATTASPPGAYPVTPSGLTSANYAVTFAPGTLTVTPVVERVAVGTGPGGAPRVKVLDAAGATVFDFFAYDEGLRGGVAVATADVTGDGTEDVITGAGVGGGTNVKVFDGTTGALVASWFAYGDVFRGGVWVAAGDVDGDGSSEVITGPGAGGGPVVKVWRVAGGGAGELASFLAFDGNLRGGATVAFARDAAGAPVIVAGAGVGDPPRVRTFAADTKQLLADVPAFEPGFTGGVYVAAGNVFGPAAGSQVVVGAGPGGGPRLRVLGLDGAERADVFAAVDTLRNGLTVGAMGEPSGSAAVLVGAGEGVFRGDLLDGALVNLTRVGFFEPGFQGGVFVG
ncbi:right-handed parallel beta-helix repeat-containing protein [bacterium]|nr:right-handed parallel beta-helix repeat-containing protein [bacterium]